jgi:ornithine cyclodeaminase
MRILNRDDVARAMKDQELAVLGAVQRAYVAHNEGQTQVPYSTFLRPPDTPDSRIIALPAYVGGRDPAIGIKWISSFPSNVDRGQQRASAVSVLNDLETGYPVAIMESSRISAARTAASAALASHVLHGGNHVHTVGLIGCGTINRATLTYLKLTHPEIRSVVVHDAVPGHAEIAAGQLARDLPDISVSAGDVGAALRADTVSIATTDSTYWLDLAGYPDRAVPQVVLHLSLRDLSVPSVLRAFNVVDDVDHALQKETSLHLAEQEVGHRAFVHATIGQLITGSPLRMPGTTAIFSPFGLGVLDLAVSAQILRVAVADGIGTTVTGFDPGPHGVTGTRTGDPT